MSLASAYKPLALTMGEPSGIGPELIARIWHKRSELKLAPFFMVGSEKAIKASSPNTPVKTISAPSEAIACFDETLPVLPIELKKTIELGTLNSANGSAVIKAIDTAVSLALAGEISGIVTAPIHKAGLYQAGFNAPGHTEYLARLAGEADGHSVMMLATEGLRVVPVTIHVPLKDVAKSLTTDKIIHTALITAHDLTTKMGIKNPRLAIAGLNPHAGEAGTIGMEEATHIMPAVWTIREHGINISDPAPADTLFHSEAREKYDAVLCMYHDQALIPIKTLDFWGGVNITLGLPFIRTSPDHGTALEIAGTGKARTDSMIAAIRAAESMAQTQAQNHG